MNEAEAETTGMLYTAQDMAKTWRSSNSSKTPKAFEDAKLEQLRKDFDATQVIQLVKSKGPAGERCSESSN